MNRASILEGILAMQLPIHTKREMSQAGLFSDYTQKLIGYIKQFTRTLKLVFTGDPYLLIRNPSILNPAVYLLGVIALAVAIIKSVWPDDPIKTFENPNFFKPFQPFLELVPLPLFAAMLVYISLVNLPMFLISKALRYRVRISRVLSLRHRATSPLLSKQPNLICASLGTPLLFRFTSTENRSSHISFAR